MLFAYVDKLLVAKDADNGWVNGATTQTVVFTGSYCDKLMSADWVVVDLICECLPPPKGIAP
jgi:hypothetical protein